MKAVVFVCLLSLSLCLSQPTSQGANSTQAELLKTSEQATSAKQNGTSDQSTVATVVKVVTIADEKPTVHTEQAITPPSNDTKLSDGKTQENKTEKVPEKVAPKPESKPEDPAKKDSSKDKPAEGPKSTDPPKPTEESKAAGNNTTPVKPVPEKTTETPKDTTEKPLVGKRGFDGPSFIGGIILTLGLLAIGFMGFKYYKNQTERNYHTL